MAPPRPVRWRNKVVWLALLAGLAMGLVITNPGSAAFEDYAGRRLSGLLREELCREQGMPLMLRLVIQDCPALIESQRPVLGRLAALQSRRLNLVLLSLYSTNLGGQTLLASWRLPRYRALTLAIAGQFLVIKASESDGEGGEEQQSWLPGAGL